MKIYNKVVINMDSQKVVEEDSYEYKGEVARCWTGAAIVAGGIIGSQGKSGGSGYPQYPGMTEEEMRYSKMRMEMLEQQRADQARMRPFELASQGLIEDEEGNIRRMTEEEYTNSMSESQRGLYEIQQQSQERLAQAYAGELPVSPGMEAQITDQEAQLRESLAQRLGPGWETTTSGQQALSEMQSRAELLREEARRGAISSESGISMARSGHLGDIKGAEGQQATGFYGGSKNLFEGYGALMSPYQRQRQQQYTGSVGGYGAMMQQRTGLMTGVGSLLGSGIEAYGRYKATH